MRRFALGYILVIAVVAFPATGGAQEDSEQTAEASSESEEDDADSSETSVDSPCGNPRWAELPPEHQIDGDPGPTEKDPRTEDSEASTDNEADEGASTSEGSDSDSSQSDGSDDDGSSRGEASDDE